MLHGEKKRLYIAEKNSTDEEEQNADRFAADILIPEEYNSLIAGFSTEQEILALARDLSLSPGIVAGRYRHLTEKWTHFKGLTRTFTWIEDK